MLSPQMLAVVLMGVILPLLAYPVLRFAGRLKGPDASSITAHYGSVSIGTSAVVVAYLASQGVIFDTLFVVLLKVPAILLDVALARAITSTTKWG